MANRERGEMALTVDGRRYLLRLTTGACCELEDRCDADLDVIVQQINQGSLTALRGLLWASLQAEHVSAFPEVESCGDLMDAMGGPAEALTVMARFMALNADDTPVPVTRQKKKSAIDIPVAGSKWRRVYLDARSSGVSAEAFWGLSLKELWREVAAVRQRQLDEHRRDVTVSWMTANLTRAAKLPELKTLLRDERAQTVEDQKQTLAKIADQFGLTLQITNKEIHRGHGDAHRG